MERGGEPSAAPASGGAFRREALAVERRWSADDNGETTDAGKWETDRDGRASLA